MSAFVYLNSCTNVPAGAVEAAFTILALRDSFAPATLNLERQIPGPWEDALIRQHPQKLPSRQKMAMSNSFGFGGVNASLLLASPPIYEDPIVVEHLDTKRIGHRAPESARDTQMAAIQTLKSMLGIITIYSRI